MNRKIVLRVTEEEHAALRKMAADNRVSMSAAFRDAVNTYVNDYGEQTVFKDREPRETE
jgi:predicted HicB family RNase H-like nuclease